eukprot:977709-Prymnesium_polylepis.1
MITESATGTPPVELHFGRAVPDLASEFVLVAPQAAEGEGWRVRKVIGFLEFLLSGGSAGSGAERLPSIERERCYITGHSMGGSGALNAAATGLFTAVASVAPGGSDRTVESTRRLQGVPCWFFHGANDSVLP